MLVTPVLSHGIYQDESGSEHVQKAFPSQASLISLSLPCAVMESRTLPSQCVAFGQA